MGYPRDLEEMREEELREEIKRREQAHRDGLCDYCNHSPAEPTCRFPERHQKAKTDG